MLKVSIIVFALLGAVASGALGLKWIDDANIGHHKIETLRAMGVDTSEVDRVIYGAYALLGSLTLGVIAAVFAFRKNRAWASGLLLVAGLVPALFTTKVLILTWMLLLAGLLALRLKAPDPHVAMA